MKPIKIIRIMKDEVYSDSAIETRLKGLGVSCNEIKEGFNQFARMEKSE